MTTILKIADAIGDIVAQADPKLKTGEVIKGVELLRSLGETLMVMGEEDVELMYATVKALKLAKSKLKGDNLIVSIECGKAASVIESIASVFHDSPL